MSSLHQNLFQITKWSPAFAPVSGQYNATANRGLALMQNGETDGITQFTPASNGFTGFLVNSVAAAPTVADIINREAFLPGGPFGLAGSRLEDPYPLPAGGKAMVAVERADEYEAEESWCIVTSGTGAITSGTALQTEVSFYQGKARVKQTGETAYFKLAAKLTPIVAANVTRFRFERI